VITFPEENDEPILPPDYEAVPIEQSRRGRKRKVVE
jgi:hypothetical protein